MSEDISNLEFAARVVEKQFSDIQSRYDMLNHKLGLYLSALAILTTLTALFIQNLISKIGTLNALFGTLKTFSFLKTILAIISGIAIILIIVCIVLAIIRIMQALTPITLQQIDDETIKTALENKLKKASEIYIRDLRSATRENQEAIRKRYSLLFSINRWLVVFLVTYAVMLVTLSISIFIT